MYFNINAPKETSISFNTILLIIIVSSRYYCKMEPDMHDWFIDKVLTPMVGPTVGPIVDKIVATIISTIIGCFLFLYLCKRVFSQKQPKSILVIILFLTLILPRFTILRGNHVLLITLLGHWGIPFTRRMVNKFAKQTRPDNPKPPVHASRRT